jgi:arsenite methyltransferase
LTLASLRPKLRLQDDVSTRDEIQAEVVERFSRIANTPEQEQKFPVGPDSAKALGYDACVIDELPHAVTESFTGVGNPLALGTLVSGQTVLDLGCGAGLDSILAAKAVAPTGKIVGIDMTKAMIDKAKKNAEVVDVENVEFIQGGIEDLPLDNESVDVAISSGVFNLCPDKPKVLREVFRVLRRGGRLQMADILLEDNVSPDEVARKGTWSD